MRRIGMVLDAPFPPDYRVEKEAITLLQAGFEVFLFCLHYGNRLEEEEYKGVHLRRYPFNKLEYKFSALAYTVPLYRFFMASKIRDFIRRNAIEVLHIHDMVIAEAAMVAARDSGCRIVLDLHENRPAIMKEYRHLNRFPGKYLINLETWSRKQEELVRKADKVVVVTELAKDELVMSTGRMPDDIAVVPNTPSVSFLDQPVDRDVLKRMEGTFNLLYIGDTSERRGTAEMLHVVRSLKDEIPEIRLWLVGKSSFDPELMRMAAALSIRQYVHFEGWQPEALFPGYIAGADVCLSPLRRNQHHDTTYANKVFQYMAIGRATIVSDCTAQAQLISRENAGLVYPAGSHQDLHNAIIRLFRDEQLKNKLGEHGRLAVRREWNWENTSKQLYKIYSDLEGGAGKRTQSK